LIKEERVILAVQVNGKLRGQIQLATAQAKSQENVQGLAEKQENIVKYLQGKKIKKVFLSLVGLSISSFNQ